VVAVATDCFRSAGNARLTVEHVDGASAITGAYATNPMKLLTPRSRAESVWAFASSFGGGLVAGDQTSVELSIGARAKCFFGTQASTKVYRNPEGKPCNHHTQADIAEGGLLVFVPDPIQAFAGSAYVQEQEFTLTETSGLVLVDWFTAGRTARGERWAFNRVASRNRIAVNGRTVLLDAMDLDAADADLTTTHQMGRFNCIATIFVLGPQLKSLSSQILDAINARPVNCRATQIVSASSIADGVLVRIAGESTESVGREIHQLLNPVSELLGDDPWARKW
jgi:urease accessory protein